MTTMDSSLITAIASVVCALIGAAGVAIPMTIQGRQNTAVMSYRMEQLEKRIDDLTGKFDKHEEHTTQIAQLQTRLDAVEYHIYHNVKKDD